MPRLSLNARVPAADGNRRMKWIDLVRIAALCIFTVNSILMTALIVSKTVHRLRQRDHKRRRAAYLVLLTQHMAAEADRAPITRRMLNDSAFLDALIDIRTMVIGGDIAALRSRRFLRVVKKQAGRLRSRALLGRRLRAAVALAELGDESSTSVLLDHLDDREPEVRIQCARGLGRIQWTPAIDRILARFNRETPWVRARLADSLLSFGDKATWPLLAYVRVSHRFETVGPALALRTLGQIGNSEVVEPLLQVLDDSSSLEIQIATIETLGELASPSAVPMLQSMFASPRWELRAKAATALGSIGDLSSVPLLRASLSDLNWWVRRNSAAALAAIPGGVGVLRTVLDADDPYAADAAAEALAAVGETTSAHRAGPSFSSLGEYVERVAATQA